MATSTEAAGEELMASPQVTAVIPTRDRPDMLRTTVRSVLAQREVTVRVVVVDDGGRQPVTSDVADGDPRVHVLRHDESRGVSRARNAGLAQAESPWVAFVDDDDLWSPRKLRRQLDALSRTPQARWACSGAAHFVAGGPVTRLLRPSASGDVLRALLAANVVPGGGSGVLAHTESLREVGGFAEDLSTLADWECWIRLAERWPLAAVDAVDVGYRLHPGSMAQDNARSSAELAELRARHADAAARVGVLLDRASWLAQLERMAYRSGNRRQGVRLTAELVLRHRRYRSAPRPLLGMLPSTATDRLSGWATRAADPTGYAETQAWIDTALSARHDSPAS